MKKLTPILENRAVDLYAHTPNIKHSDVAKELGISDKTLRKLRKISTLWDRVYSTFMQSFEGELPDILRAMCREAKAGNQMAARLVLEHSGKLQKNIHVTIASPFEQWLASNGESIDPSKEIVDAEIVVDELPQSNDTTSKKDNTDWNKRRRELHKWQKRAKACGIEQLPARRPTPGQRKAWEDSIVKAEGL